MRLAIVADWLTTFGGAEHVLAQLHALYPDAPLFTTVARREKLGPLADADIRTTRLQHIYRWTSNHQILLPLMPRAIEDIDLTGYDIVISSSHAVAKGVVVPSTTLHLCYCHTPMRYAWEMEEEYLRDFGIPRLLRPAVKRMLSRMRRWDLTTAKRVDVFLANSKTTQERIARIYASESIVIPPPVDDRFFGHPLTTHYPIPNTQFLAIGRLVPYKRFDLLIALANELHLPLLIAGRGQDEARLKKLAGPTVTFLGFVPDEDLPALYAQAKALLFPQHEDAGIVPLEAQACGTPVIALNKGGALETILDGITGLFFAEQSTKSIRDALQRFDTMTWDRQKIRDHARQFSQTEFRRKMETMIAKEYENFPSSSISHGNN